MKQVRIKTWVLVTSLMAIAFILVFVYPTPWERMKVDGTVIRVNRFTGVGEQLTLNGWEHPTNAPKITAPPPSNAAPAAGSMGEKGASSPEVEKIERDAEGNLERILITGRGWIEVSPWQVRDNNNGTETYIPDQGPSYTVVK